MRHVLDCLHKNRGIRGVTFYDSDSAHFLTWDQVVAFLGELGESTRSDDDHPFEESLLETMSNYDPDNEFLSVRQEGLNVSIELFRIANRVKPSKDMW
jgi:hypothetical protein